ncbi:MAG: polyprenyl synthetase family protein, partial [Dehalococcoidia bacterium]|nr:polyprenyl synthetase family protein [Dehalococcoidia bacterium]
MTTAPAVFSRYREPLGAALRQALEGADLPIYGMARYHLGWQDREGNTTEAEGKALRPVACLLSCEALGGNFERALPAAAAIELVHNFSLVHDDIQDGDEERRGRPTVWKLWGAAQAINAGDLLWALANRVLARATWPAAAVAAGMEALNDAALRMIEGQYLDLAFEGQTGVGVDDYLAMTGRKTGALFGAALELGALAAGADNRARDSLRESGENLGVSFQIHDDVLGIWGDSALTGKSARNDILRRKKSLPLLHA